MTGRELRAARKAKQARRCAAPEPVFSVDGLLCPLSKFIAANADDPDVVSWAGSAQVGDAPAVVPCVRQA